MTAPEEAAVDKVAPTTPKVLGVDIIRGESAGCSDGGSSCDDIGTVSFALSAGDDRTPSEQLGYRVSLVAGTLPAGLSLPATPVKSPGGVVWLHWLDGATRGQEEIAFTLGVRVLDLAGNESPLVEVPVHDSSRLGCGLGGTRVHDTPVLLLMALAWVRFVRGRKHLSAPPDAGF